MAEYNIVNSVFPVYEICRNSDGNYSDGYYKGTCFCVTIAEIKVLVTAKHIFSGLNQDKELAIFSVNKENKVIIHKIFALQVNNLLEDFGFIIPIGDFKIFIDNKAKAFEIFNGDLKHASNIISYGFPLSDRRVNLDNSISLNVIPMVFRGYIQGIWEDSERGKFNKIYAVSFPSLPGLSGAPLLIESNNNLLVCGIMHEHRSLGRIAVDETIVDGNIVERQFRSYEIGISSDREPFLEIEKLINEKGLQEKVKKL